MSHTAKLRSLALGTIAQVIGITHCSQDRCGRLPPAGLDWFCAIHPAPVAPVNRPFPGSGATTPTIIARVEAVTAITQSDEKHLYCPPTNNVSERRQ